MEADLPLTENTNLLILIDLTVYLLNSVKIEIKMLQITMIL